MALLRSLATVGGFTGISRILGFVRDILMAAVLGTGPVADAFFIAFRFPNFFRRALGEGAFNAAFVPLFSRRLEEHGPEIARRFAEEVMAVLLTALLAMTLAAILAMPWLMQVLAPGFVDDPEKFELAVLLTRLTFPYLLFMALVALLGGVLNSLYRFAAAAAAPILLNIVFIVALSAVVPIVGSPGQVLAWAVTFAGIGQFIWLVWSCRQAGIELRLPLPRLTPGVRRTLRLMGPGLVSAGALQLNLVVGTIIASLQDGAVSYIYYADRIYQLPLGLIGIAFGVVLLPELSRKLRAGQEEAATTSLNRGMELALLLTLPAAVALMAIPWPIITVLFERGAFGPQASIATAWALAAFATGLPAYVLVKILQPAFFAREDTLSPLKSALAGVAVNIGLSIGLFFVLGHVGIALATSVAAWLNAGLLALWLRQAGHMRPDRRFRRRLPRILAASVLMGGVLLAMQWGLVDWFKAGPHTGIPGLILLVGGGLGVYGLLAVGLGAANTRELAGAFRRARPSRASAEP